MDLVITKISLALCSFSFLLQIETNVRRTLSSVESGQHCRQGLWTRGRSEKNIGKLDPSLISTPSYLRLGVVSFLRSTFFRVTYV